MHPCYVCGGNCNCDIRPDDSPNQCFCQECELDLNVYLEEAAVDFLARQRAAFQGDEDQ